MAKPQPTVVVPTIGDVDVALPDAGEEAMLRTKSVRLEGGLWPKSDEASGTKLGRYSTNAMMRMKGRSDVIAPKMNFRPIALPFLTPTMSSMRRTSPTPMKSANGTWADAKLVSPETESALGR